MLRVILFYPFLVSFLALAYVGQSSANSKGFGEWKERLSASYIMGSSETRHEAIQAARGVLKEQAASKAGSYVHGTERLKAGEVQSDVEVISASLVQLSEEQVSMDIVDNNQLRIRLEAVAHIDTQALELRVAASEHDRDLRRRLRDLRVENQNLRANEASMEQWIEPEVAWAEHSGSKVYGDHSIRFTEEDIVSLAQEREASWHAIRDHWVESFYSQFRDAPIKASIEGVRKAREGESFDYKVTVEVDPVPFVPFDNRSEVYTKLGRLFAWYGTPEPYEDAISHASMGYERLLSASWTIKHSEYVDDHHYSEGSPLAFRHELHSFLKANPIHIEISLGDQTERVFLFGVDDSERRRRASYPPVEYDSNPREVSFELTRDDIRKVKGVEVSYSLPELLQ